MANRDGLAQGIPLESWQSMWGCCLKKLFYTEFIRVFVFRRSVLYIRLFRDYVPHLGWARIL